MDLTRRLVLVAATLGCALVAGLLFAFAVAVMPALARTDDRTFVAVMQRINTAIVNPPFLLAFLGTPLFAITAAVLFWGRPGWAWVVAGAALYLAVVAITAAVHIPLNDRLAAAQEDLEAARTAFEGRWVAWHTARTLAGVASLVCLALALSDG